MRAACGGGVRAVFGFGEEGREMRNACAMRDPELSAEERANLLHGGKQKRVVREAALHPGPLGEERELEAHSFFVAMHAAVDAAAVEGGSK